MTATAKPTAGFIAADVERNTEDLAGRIRRAVGNFRAYRTTLADLGGLSDRQLADLGMSRDRLKGIARGAVYGN